MYLAQCMFYTSSHVSITPGALLSLHYFCTLGIENVIICEIGHVCVKATVYGCLKRGINAHVVVDAISSCSMADREGNIA